MGGCTRKASRSCRAGAVGTFLFSPCVAVGFNHARHREVTKFYARGLRATTAVPSVAVVFVGAVLQPDGKTAAVTCGVPIYPKTPAPPPRRAP